MSETAAKLRRFALNDQEWTPIVAPCACNYFYAFNEDTEAMLRCSDQSNANAWYSLSKGQGCGLLLPSHELRRFEPGDIVTYLKAAPGTSSTAIVEFIP